MRSATLDGPAVARPADYPLPRCRRRRRGPGHQDDHLSDLMKFRAIQAPVLSDDGDGHRLRRSSPIAGTARAWCTCSPAARSTACRVAARPVISKTGRYVGMMVKPVVRRRGEGRARTARSRAWPSSTRPTGTVVPIENVERLGLLGRRAVGGIRADAARAEEGREGGGACRRHRQARRGGREEAPGVPPPPQPADGGGPGPGAGGDIRLRPCLAPRRVDRLDRRWRRQRPVRCGALPSLPARRSPSAQAPKGRYESLTWTREGSRLAFLAAMEKEKDKPGPATLWVWDGATRQGRAVAAPEQAPDGWTLPVQERPVLVARRQAALLRVQAGRAGGPGRQARGGKGAEAIPDPYDLRAAPVEGRAGRLALERPADQFPAEDDRGTARRTGRIAPSCTPRPGSWSAWPISTCPTSRPSREPAGRAGLLRRALSQADHVGRALTATSTWWTSPTARARWSSRG